MQFIRAIPASRAKKPPPTNALPALVVHCVELLAPLGQVRTKRMFGGWGLYVDELFIAIIAFERLYLKTDASTAPRFAAAGSEIFTMEMQGHTASMGYWTAPAEAMDAPHAMEPWARLAMQSALTARAAKAPAVTRKKPAAAPAAAKTAKKTAAKTAMKIATKKPAAKRRPAG